MSGKEKEEKQEASKKSYALKPGEKVVLAKGKESPPYDKTEAVPGIMVGKKAKFI